MEGELSLGGTLALIALISFAIQRLAEFMGAVIAYLVGEWHDWWHHGQYSMSDNMRKSMMFIVAFFLGLVTVVKLDIRLLGFIPDVSVGSGWDVLVSALILSAGTESANSLQKYAEYAKDRKKS